MAAHLTETIAMFYKSTLKIFILILTLTFDLFVLDLSIVYTEVSQCWVARSNSDKFQNISQRTKLLQNTNNYLKWAEMTQLTS